VRYLRRGVQWYSPEYLVNVDVLIPMLDQYDLSRTLSLFQDPTPPPYPTTDKFHCTEKLQIKPNLITIAWARNWFHRWLIRPWIGNYDALLTSSSLSKSFFDTIDEKIGFSATCSICCPRKIPGYRLKQLPDHFLSGKPASTQQKFNQSRFNATEQKVITIDSPGSWQIFPSRAHLPVHVYPIATAIDVVKFNYSQTTRGCPSGTTPTLSSKSKVLKYDPLNNVPAEAQRLFSGVDYVFTGSYFNVYRRIMSFDPDQLPQHVGRIVGGGWEKVQRNVTPGWTAITTGLLPYELVKEVSHFVLFLCTFQYI
jgi:hypothetical protein